MTTINTLSELAKLLAPKKNPTFTGTVTAPTFVGQLTGNADTATNATNDGTGKNIANTYATKTEDRLKAPIANPIFTGKATAPTFVGQLTGNADTATNATNDGTGKNIANTYATKEENALKAPLASPTFTGTVTAPTFVGALTGKAETAGVADSAKAVAWENISGKPELSVAGHKHIIDDVTGLQDALDGKLGVHAIADAAIKATQDKNGDDIVQTYATKSALTSGLAGKLGLHAKADGAKVADSVDWSGIKNLPESFTPSVHTHPISQIVGLGTALAGKQPVGNYATQADISDVETRTHVAATYATKADTYTKDEVDGKVASVYKYKGSVATKKQLEAKPTSGNVVGDVWDVQEDGANYAWNGTAWDNLGGTVDLSAYLKSTDAAKTYATKSALTSGLAGKLGLHDTADAAVKAYQDGNGKVIVDTYATKAEISDIATDSALKALLKKVEDLTLRVKQLEDDKLATADYRDEIKDAITTITG